MSFLWNSNNLALAKLRWRQGNTGAEIAREIGATRGAVIGKLWREGCTGLTTAEKSRRQSRANSAAMLAYWQSVRASGGIR